MPTSSSLLEVIDNLPLFDHHCHGVVEDDLDRAVFESLISESSRPAAVGTTRFDSQLGVQILTQCPPLFGVQQFCSPDDYLAARSNVGSTGVNQRLLHAARITSMGVDTGHAASRITDPQTLEKLSGSRAHEIVRLEALAEEVAADLREKQPGGAGSAASVAVDSFLGELEKTLDARLKGAIGVKSIAAYRCGLDFSPRRPSSTELKESVETFLQQPAPFRLEDPVLVRHLLWLAIDRQQVIQLHIGYGDDDVDLHRCNPLLLTDLLRASRDTGARFALLHCYPYVRESGYLADVFEHVYFDVGLAINYTGAHSPRIIAEALEIAPFGKILFSTDAFGLPELYFLGAELFRHGLAEVLDHYHRTWSWPIDLCKRIAAMLCYDNAARLYNIDDRDDGAVRNKDD